VRFLIPSKGGDTYMDKPIYKDIVQKISDKIKTTEDANSALNWAECLKNIAIAFSVDADCERKLSADRS
jgi:hypothetical protein